MPVTIIKYSSVPDVKTLKPTTSVTVQSTGEKKREIGILKES